MKKQLHLVIKGRVQGVGFRHFAVQQAKRFGVCGFVQNLANGDVKTVAEGEDDALKGYFGAVREGPTFAHVDDYLLDWSDYQGKYHDFAVKY